MNISAQRGASSRSSGLVALTFAAVATTSAAAQPAGELAPYFGWEDPRIVVVDKRPGPALLADMNSDGLLDLVVVNNSKSRIELHLQRRSPRTDAEVGRDLRPNELPPSPYFDRIEVSVAHRVTSVCAMDADSDGRIDLLYAGLPGELVLLRQEDSTRFDVKSKRRVQDLTAGRSGMAVADVTGDEAPEVLVQAKGRILVYSLTSNGAVGEPLELGSAGSKDSDIAALFVEDYDGDGLQDVMGVVPDHDAPLRLWLQEGTPASAGSATRAPRTAKFGRLGAENRFEMPALREVDPVRFPGRAGASIAVIERASRRIVVYDLNRETEGTSGAAQPRARSSTSARSDRAAADAGGAGDVPDRDVMTEVFAFPGATAKGRSVVVGDIDADGLADLLAADQQGNALLFYRHEPGIGIAREERFSAFREPKTIATGQWDGAGPMEIFVLSEVDKAVGVATLDSATRRITFPQPVPLATPGAAPVAMSFTMLKDGPSVSIIVKDKRDHTLEIHRPAAAGAPPGATVSVAFPLEGVTRPPQSIISGDFDHDGKTDLLLLTPAEPLIMVRSVGGKPADMQLLTDKTMPQFGLVSAAGPDNTAMLDVDDDGFEELLIADKNFVRACAFSVERGWRVVEQVTMPDSSSQLVGLAVFQPGAPGADALGAGPTIVAADKAGKRLVLMRRNAAGAWSVADRMRFSGFDITSVAAGSFTGDGRPCVLAISDAAFAIVPLRGQRLSLEEVTAYRSDSENRLEHEIVVGDLNSDGYLDMVVLDARERMCQIFTFTASRRLLLATEWTVFESRLFQRGDDREFQPANAFIGDLTGDGVPDLTLEAHDRYLVYPQMMSR